MNVTALVIVAAATHRALLDGETTDAATVKLIDVIYNISGADPCVFNACNGNRRVTGLGRIGDVMMGRIDPDWYDETLYGEFFGWCRDFITAFPPAPVISTVLNACNSTATSRLVAAASTFQACTNGEVECMATACNLDVPPLLRAVRAAASVEAALIRRVASIDTELRGAYNQLEAYLVHDEYYYGYDDFI